MRKWLIALVLIAALAGQARAADVCFTMSDSTLVKLVTAITFVFGYQDSIEVPGPGGSTALVPNPETRGQFSRRMVITWMRGVRESYNERVWAQQRAREAALGISSP